jgi:hypothetical protein
MPSSRRFAVIDYSILFPDGFDDYAWEVQSKGWFSDVKLAVFGKQYRISFYDPVRLSQEIQDEILRGGVFFEPNVVVAQSINRQSVESAIQLLIETERANSLVPE